MGITIDTSQVRALAARVGTAGLRIGAAGSKVLRRTAFAIEADAKVLAPNVTGYTPSGAVSESTGDLRNSISTTIRGDGRFGSMSAEVGPTVEYGLFQEVGTSVMPPQPYLGPAFDRHAPTYGLALAAVLADEVL